MRASCERPVAAAVKSQWATQIAIVEFDIDDSTPLPNTSGGPSQGLRLPVSLSPRTWQKPTRFVLCPCYSSQSATFTPARTLIGYSSLTSTGPTWKNKSPNPFAIGPRPDESLLANSLAMPEGCTMNHPSTITRSARTFITKCMPVHPLPYGQRSVSAARRSLCRGSKSAKPNSMD